MKRSIIFIIAISLSFSVFTGNDEKSLGMHSETTVSSADSSN
jgi:hypothetical protein